MLNETPSTQGLDIVLVGDFNPKIFQPAWFGAEKLIRSQEAEKADIKIISSEIVVFELDWLEIQVTRDRFLIGTSQEAYYEVVRDLCLSTFRLLRHTPIQKMGINKSFHFKMKSEEEWHAFGHKVAPKELWDTFLKNPGLLSLSIQAMREDDLKGYIKVKVEPSKREATAIYIHINDHYEIQEDTMGCDRIIDILESCWEKSSEKTDTIVNNILGWQK